MVKNQRAIPILKSCRHNAQAGPARWCAGPGIVFAIPRILTAALVLCFPLASKSAFARDRSNAELDVEAAYLPRLAPFIEWPIDAFATPDSPLVICILASDPMTGRVAKVARSQKDGRRPIALRVIASPDRVRECHIIYLGPSDDSAARVTEMVRDRPVLTVWRSRPGESKSAMVAFVVDHDRVRFDIDAATAVRARLSISSKLLALARDVHRAPPPR